MKEQPRLASLTALLLGFSLLAPVAAQETQTRTTTTPASTTTARPQQQPGTDDSEDDVVRITSNLVQIDVVVTDKQGRLVTDLRPEDFEVTVDGKQQQITNFSFVSNESRTVTTPPAGPVAAKGVDKNAPPVPAARLRPEQVRRTIALVADDLGTSFESMAHVRRALKKFVDEQMQPGDLVAIMRTSAGMGALQQFTSDKRLLYAAIERVRWSPNGRVGVSAFAPLEGNVPSPGGPSRGDDDPDEARDGAQELENFREDVFSVGTLGAINFIVKGMGQLPGRKSVVMFSEGFEMYRKNEQSVRLVEALSRLTEQANRASVVIYTIDPRGLVTFGLNAADDTSGMSQQGIMNAISGRSKKLFETQGGLQYLAEQTGGFLIRNANDLSGGVQRVLDDQKGYYLIGYRPDEATFRQTGGRVRFNKFHVKVLRSGLRVRTRNGFYGITDEESRPVARTRIGQLVGAIASPFASGDVALRLTSVFNSESEKANFVSSLMHIDMKNVKFTEEPDDWHKTVLDVVALTFGENGNVIDEINRTETVRARGATFERLKRDGLIYVMKVPVKKPGAYQLRVAVRDAATEKIGAASQFIEVPNLKKDRLALSGIMMQGSDLLASAGTNASAVRSDVKEGQSDDFDPLSSPAVRRFRQGAEVDYFFHIYNAKADRATGRPQLQTQMRLYRDGQLVFEGRQTPFEPVQTADMTRLMVGARIKLGVNLAPGQYVLQVIVTDALAKERYRVATQWTDFEIIK